MSFVISALIPGAQGLLNNRPVASWNNTIAEYARKGAIELQENYKFAELQTTGPIVEFTPLVANYSTNYFLSSGDQNLDLKKVNSFFIYNTGYAALSSNTQTNSGYNLKFKTIDDIEVLINIPGIPLYWTRHEGDLWFGSVPDQNYSVYMRYQHENAFPNAGTEAANNDIILMPNTWQDIMEYNVAMRAARDLNLGSKANELFMALYGDQKFQTSDGLEGSPGLIFQRTSQENRDQTTSMKSLKLRMSVG